MMLHISPDLAVLCNIVRSRIIQVKQINFRVQTAVILPLGHYLSISPLCAYLLSEDGK